MQDFPFCSHRCLMKSFTAECFFFGCHVHDNDGLLNQTSWGQTVVYSSFGDCGSLQLKKKLIIPRCISVPGRQSVPHTCTKDAGLTFFLPEELQCTGGLGRWRKIVMLLHTETFKLLDIKCILLWQPCFPRIGYNKTIHCTTLT
ncbi:hypothetical protein SKAU_G00346630 [Synaphobranchus kaupii]|uniref:Uncharacterized protein n=1 Tax=Synaphobranchus kaupii TaxID=118154 RepID=A0A9Q1EJV0_SYNKA|nr:hypothetical protein SKAU_G00346630 [Synaphobranchus kaupii]